MCTCALCASVAISSNFKFYLHSLGISVFVFFLLFVCFFSSFSFTFPSFSVSIPFLYFYLGIQTCCILLCDRKLEQRRRRRRRLKWSPTSRITAISLIVCLSVCLSVCRMLFEFTNMPHNGHTERGRGRREKEEGGERCAGAASTATFVIDSLEHPVICEVISTCCVICWGIYIVYFFCWFIDLSITMLIASYRWRYLIKYFCFQQRIKESTSIKIIIDIFLSITTKFIIIIDICVAVLHVFNRKSRNLQA